MGTNKKGLPKGGLLPSPLNYIILQPHAGCQLQGVLNVNGCEKGLREIIFILHSPAYTFKALRAQYSTLFKLVFR
jgi:hypothetical protein